MNQSGELQAEIPLKQSPSTEHTNPNSFFDNNYMFMYQMAYSILQDDFLAKDITFEAFMRLKKNKTKYRYKLSKRAWGLQITRDIAYAILEKRNLAIPKVDNLNQIASIQRNLDKDNFYSMLSYISAIEKDILFLHLYCNLSFNEVAILVNLSNTDTQAHYTMALDTLSKILSDETQDERSFSPIVIVATTKKPIEVTLIKAASRLSSPKIDPDHYETFCSPMLLEQFKDHSLAMSLHFQIKYERRIRAFISISFLSVILMFLLYIVQLNLSASYESYETTIPVFNSLQRLLTGETIIAR